MNTPLQQAAQALIYRWDTADWKSTKHTADFVNALRKALAEEQAQAGEPVAWSVTVGDDFANCIEITHCKEDAYAKYEASTAGGFESVYRIRPLYTRPAPQPYDQQALELCESCGWKAVIPGEPCLNCGRGEVMKALDAYAAERDALMADGARYQFMKSCSRAAGLDISGWHSWTCQIMRSDIKGATLDEAIDSAIKKAGIETKAGGSAA